MRPTPEARAALDRYIKGLALIGDGLTIDEFRIRSLERAQRVGFVVRATLYKSGLIFMAMLLASLMFYDWFAHRGLLWIGVWALSLGGLGSIASVFLHLLKLVPKESLQSSDEVEVFGRIFLGCLFSLVLSLTLMPVPMLKFFAYIGNPTGKDAAPGGLQLLLPFLCGYSIPLVLGLLGKAISAIELTVGLDDRRAVQAAKSPRRRRNP